MRILGPAAVLLASMLGVAGSATGDEVTTAGRLDLVPEHLKIDHQRAILAWQGFVIRDKALYDALRDATRDPKPHFYYGVLADPKLQSYLYPWARTARTDERRKLRPLPPPHSVFQGFDWKGKSLHIALVRNDHFGDKVDPDQPVRDVAVHVTKTDKPVVLLLASEPTVRWKLSAERDVRIAKVIISGPSDSEIVHPPSVASAISRMDPPGFFDLKPNLRMNFWAGFFSASRWIEALTGTRFTTIQSTRSIRRYPSSTRLSPACPDFQLPHELNRIANDCNEGRSEIVIDGRKGAVPANPVPQADAVAFFFYDEEKRAQVPTLTVDADNNPHDVWASTMNANTGSPDWVQRAAGRWYWEVRYERPSPPPESRPFVGVTDRTSGSGSSRTSVYGIVDAYAHLLRGGEMIRFALDFDRSMLFVGIDDAWVLGDPARNPNGIKLPAEREQIPIVRAEKSSKDPYGTDRFTFNFGATPFRHRIPDGFEPFDVRFKSARLRESSALRHSAPKQFSFDTLDRDLSSMLQSAEDHLPKSVRDAAVSAFEDWKRYRDSTCRLVRRSRSIPSADSRELDVDCALDYMVSFEQKLAELKTVLRNAAPKATSDDFPTLEANRQGKLHYVRLDGWERSLRKREPAAVSVTDASAPLVLLLHSNTPIDWQVSLGPGVAVEHLLLFGYRKQTATVTRPPSSVRSYSEEEGTGHRLAAAFRKGAKSRLDLTEELTALFGIPPSTMQFDCPRDACVVDGERSWKYQQPSSRPDAEVQWISFPDRVPLGKSTRPTKQHEETIALTSEARREGKWYLEVEAAWLDSPSKFAWGGGTAGVVEAETLGQRDQLLYHNSVTVGSALKIQPGSVVMIAVNLDDGRAYYGVDGKWLIGDPVAATGGKPLRKGRDHHPAVLSYRVHADANGKPLAGAQHSSRWIGRFFKDEFRHPMPAGYRPYQTVPSSAASR